jgi:hypothetical protein
VSYVLEGKAEYLGKIGIIIGIGSQDIGKDRHEEKREYNDQAKDRQPVLEKTPERILPERPVF